MSTETKKFYRSREGRILGGVCAGLGNIWMWTPR